MNPYVLSFLVALGLAATIRYFIGMRSNRRIASHMAKEAQRVLGAVDSEYVNIGGFIGHNFTYRLREPWTSAKGTFTLSPRHSLLYLPISLLMGFGDRFYVNLFTKKKLLGEMHLIEAGHLRRAKIDGIETMDRREILRENRRFVILWKGGKDETALLEKALDAMGEPRALRHFCCYPANKTVFIQLAPLRGEIGKALGSLEHSARAFISAKGGADGRSDDEEV